MSDLHYDGEQAFLAANRERSMALMKDNTAEGAFARAHDLVREIEDWFEREDGRVGREAALQAYVDLNAHLLAHGICCIARATHDVQKFAPEFINCVLEMLPDKLSNTHAFSKTSGSTT